MWAILIDNMARGSLEGLASEAGDGCYILTTYQPDLDSAPVSRNNIISIWVDLFTTGTRVERSMSNHTKEIAPK